MKALETLFYPSITFNMKDYSISARLYWVFSLFTLVYFFPFNKKNAVLPLNPNKNSVEKNYSKCLYENNDVSAYLYKQIHRGASKVWETTMIRRVQRHTFIRNSGVLGLSISQIGS